MSSGLVTAANLGADFDLGSQVANKVNIVVATTSVAGKSRLAAAADLASGAAGAVIDAAGGKATFLVKGRTPIASGAYQVLVADRRVVLTNISASLTWTLPAAAAFDPKEDLYIWDETGALSSTLALTIAAAGSDTISGLASIDMTQPYQKLLFHSNGSNLWTYR